MAAKPPKPPTNSTIYENNKHQTVNQSSISSSSSTATSPDDPDDLNSNNNISNINKYNYQSYRKIKNNLTDCPCTNISIMQLFHEMKQEFPTVPDHIVNQCVIDNCHDRETCIENLKRELATHPNTVQSYPAQILRNKQKNYQSNQLKSMCNNKVLLKPTRPAPVPKVNNCNINSCNNTELINYNNNKINISNNTNSQKFNNSNKALLSRKTTIYNVQQSKKLPTKNCESDNRQGQVNTHSHVPQRPTTLSFREPFSDNQTGGFDNRNQQRVVHKPTRKAPLPPTSKSQQDPQIQQSQLVQSPSTHISQLPQFPSTPSTVPYFANSNDHSYSSASIQSPLSFSDSGESEISVNISLSPSSDIHRTTNDVGASGCVGGPFTRRTTSITIEPEPPYMRDYISQNPRSYTSLNLTLRKPTTAPQSPIDITAGPGLTYSSSSFDARLGCQKSFHITVTNQGSTFSASRVRPRTAAVFNANVPSVCPENEIMAANSLSPSTPNSLMIKHVDDISSLFNIQSNNDYVSQENDETSLIQRQQNRKDTLVKCLQKNKQKLELVQNEIKILTSPVKAGESERLDNEIEKLRCDCQNILQEIENTKRIALPTNNSNYNNQQSVVGEQRRQSLQYQQQQSPDHNLSPLSLPSLSLQYQHPSVSPSDDLEVSIAAGGKSQRPITTVTLNQQQQQQEYIDEINPDGDLPWTCSMCTFQNHPLLNKCECCDNIKQISGTEQSSNIDTNDIAFQNNSSVSFGNDNNFDVDAATANTILNSSVTYNKNSDMHNNLIDSCISDNNQIPNNNLLITNFDYDYDIVETYRDDNNIAEHFAYLPFNCDQIHNEDNYS